MTDKDSGSESKDAAHQRRTLHEISTPALILDRTRLEQNLQAMERRAHALGVRLRPHAKTPKCTEILARLMAGGAIGITTATIAEMECAAAAGIKDIFYAVAVDHRKVARIAAIQRGGASPSVLVDSVEGARLCAAAAADEAIRLDVWIEIDIDGYRTGIDPAAQDFLAIAQLVDSHPATRLRGLMSYGGISYRSDGAEGRRVVAERHRCALLDARQTLAQAGIRAEELSFGSGPAVQDAASFDGLTEVRCGIYIFQDLFQAAIGACRVEDIAVSVLASVIGHDRARNRLVIDAGGLALSKDRSTAGTAFDVGYGLVARADDCQPVGDLFVADVSQEIGLVTSRSGLQVPLEALPIGARVRILPNHADMTAAAYPGYQIVDGGSDILGYWPRFNFW